MKKGISLLLTISLLFILSANVLASTPNSAFAQKAKNIYNPLLKKTVLNVSQNDVGKEYHYNSIYIPVKDLFANHVQAITWDNVRKIILVKNQGSELVLNFSGKEFKVSNNQVVLPTEWIKLENGRAGINCFVLAYIFDRNADSLKDKEREAWKDKLSFLNIDWTDGLPGVNDGYMHVSVNYNNR